MMFGGGKDGFFKEAVLPPFQNIFLFQTAGMPILTEYVIEVTYADQYPHWRTLAQCD